MACVGSVGGVAYGMCGSAGGVACVDQPECMVCVGSAGVCGMCGSDENAFLTLQVVLVLLSSTLSVTCLYTHLLGAWLVGVSYMPGICTCWGVACGGVLYALYMHLLGAWLVGVSYMPCIHTCWGRGLWGCPICPVYAPAGGVACGRVLYALYMHLLGAWLVGDQLGL